QPRRPPTHDPEWNKRQVVLGQPEQPWFNEMVSATKDPLIFNDLMGTPIDFSKVLDFDLGYNKEISRKTWTATDKKRSKLMDELIDKQMRERRIIWNLERLVGARELEMDYKRMTRIV
ncbi:hypothetical protein Tco_1225790, partial [Tanacetum coccineum]